MPNWCYNVLEIQGDEQSLNEIANHFEQGSFLNYCKQLPPELKEDGWYNWCIENWGTKWEIRNDDFSCLNDGELGKLNIVDGKQKDGTKHLECSFNSAWAPPIKAYQALKQKNPKLRIKSAYYEMGNDFCGVWDNGVDALQEGIPESADGYWDSHYGQYLNEQTCLLDAILNDEQEREEE